MFFRKKKPQKSKTEKLVREISNLYGLDPRLIASVILTESSGVQDALRLEQGFYVRYVKDQADLMLVEKVCRASSFGLMQIMGETARHYGFMNDFSLLEKPDVNISLGCKILSTLLKKKNGDVRKALLGYNGGGDPGYPNRVLEKIDNLYYKKLWDIEWKLL